MGVGGPLVGREMPFLNRAPQLWKSHRFAGRREGNTRFAWTSRKEMDFGFQWGEFLQKTRLSP